MLKFTSEADLLRLNPTNPACPIIQDLVQRIIVDSYGTEYEYDESADGFICLLDSGDTERPLSDIWEDDDPYYLIDVPWEGITLDDTGQFYLAVFLANNQYGICFVIPTHIVHGELLECIEAHLDE